MKINRFWHAANPMPKNPTLSQCIDWHSHHAEACGCRPIPESIKQTMAALNSSDVTIEPATVEGTKYMVAIPIPEPLTAILVDLQQSYHNKRWHITIEPHITIISPGLAKVGLDQAVELFRLIDIHQAPPTIQLSGINRFHSRKQNALYLGTSQTDWLAEVNQLLTAEAEAWQDTITNINRRFVPHLTVSNHLPDDEAIDFKLRLIESSLGYEFPPIEIALYYKTQQNLRWQRLVSKKFMSSSR